MATNVDDHSEFEGGGLMPNTVFPKGTEALTASDQLRLQSITGQETDSRAPVDPWFWNGGQYSPRALDGVEADRRVRQQRNSQLRREASDRYKESPY
jgi:hypothetical protein